MRSVRCSARALAALVLVATATRAQSVTGQQGTGGVTQRSDTLGALAAGGRATCVTTTRGAGWCWNVFGFTSAGVTRMHDVAGQPAVVRTLSTGGWHVCGLTMKSEVVCDIGLVGSRVDSNAKENSLPATCRYRSCLRPLPSWGGPRPATVRQIAVDLMHACALARNGVPYCWGGGDSGRFAINTLGKGIGIQDSVRASNADALRFDQIATGNRLFCGVTEPEGAIHCWGDLLAGQPRDTADYPSCEGAAPVTCGAELQSRVVPEVVSRWEDPWRVRFTRVAAGSSLGCGIDDRANAYCWGSNYRCALGQCRSPDSFRAHRIPISGRVVDVGAGYWFACARTADGRVFCWGDNHLGQLGSLTTVNAGADGMPPDYRDSTNARTMAAARDDPCFNGGRCSPVPVEVSPGRRWAALAVGSDHACALSADDGGVYCWGDDNVGVLGGAASLPLCVNRSATWKDEHCQPTPIRVAGLPPLAPPRDSVADRARQGRVTVRVSRREVRASFHTDTTRGWGWTASKDVYYRGLYDWSLGIAGMDGPQSLTIMLGRDKPDAREFGSLADVVRAARAIQCSGGGMMPACSAAGMDASVEGDAVVLVLRDSARIARLFGMRPAFVRATEVRPERRESWSDSVSVEYVEPQIPAPNAATRADARRSQRRFEQSITSVGRFIDAPGEHGGALRLSVGDSVAVFVDESHCIYDSCAIGVFPPPTDSGWHVDDERIAKLVALDNSKRDLSLMTGARYYLKAVRPGRTTLRVHGVHSAADSAVSSQAPARELERGVTVTLPLSRIAITPRPDTVVSGKPLSLQAIVRDTTGQPIGDVPVTFNVEGLGYSVGTSSLTQTPIEVRGRGRRRIVAKAGSLSDTLFVTVVDSSSFVPK